MPPLLISANRTEYFGSVTGCGVGVVFVTRGGLRRFDRSEEVELTWVGDLFDSVDRIAMPTAAEGVVAFVLLVSTWVVGRMALVGSRRPVGGGVGNPQGCPIGHLPLIVRARSVGDRAPSVHHVPARWTIKRGQAPISQ